MMGESPTRPGILKLNPLVVGRIGVALHQAFLYFDSALDRIDNARELDQQPVASGLYDASLAASDSRLNQFVEMRVESSTRPHLILSDEAAVADHVGS